jgi:hypothetical protein
MRTFCTTIHADDAIDTAPSGLPIALPPANVLLRRHDRAQRQHPADASRADREHQQDRQSAAADAEQAVIHAELKAPAARAQAAPMAGDAHERRAAFVETSMLEAAELTDAGDRDDRGVDQPAMRQH